MWIRTKWDGDVIKFNKDTMRLVNDGEVWFSATNTRKKIDKKNDVMIRVTDPDDLIFIYVGVGEPFIIFVHDIYKYESMYPNKIEIIKIITKEQYMPHSQEINIKI